MNKENNKSAAGLRRSAIAERIRLREEWSALKEVDTQPLTKQNKNVKQRVKQVRGPASTFLRPMPPKCGRESSSNNVLRGVVCLVEVGAEARALPLRAALSALGASVLPAWSPLVTHLVWAQGGCRQTRARARALASSVVSPLWVEACASAGRRLPERAFPAASRSSDLPSPRTLRRLLKKAEMENILIADSPEKMPRLRISSETEQDSSKDTSIDTSKDTSVDTSKDTSLDISKDTSNTTNDKDTSCDKTKADDTTDIECRVNTAPRRALPKVSESLSPIQRPVKSRRKLFTQKEAEMVNDDSRTTKPTNTTKAVTKSQVSILDRKELARAEKLAKKLLNQCKGVSQTRPCSKTQFRIVLTGMSGEERRVTTLAIRHLKGKIQAEVDFRTTHVILGSCVKHDDIGVPYHPLTPKPRTLKALKGAAMGCRVVYAKWATDSQQAQKWLHTTEYEVPHLKKISQKARVERSALNKKNSHYAYDVFNGMRVSVSQTAEQREGAIELLKLCGAIVVDGTVQNGTHQNRIGNHQNGVGTHQNQVCATQNRFGTTQNRTGTQFNILGTQFNRENDTGTFHRDFDVRIGDNNGEISSKWVFDSVASARMRTARRYVVNSLSNSEMVNQLLEGI